MRPSGVAAAAIVVTGVVVPAAGQCEPAWSTEWLTGPGGVAGSVFAIESSPPRLYAGGSFVSAGATTAARIAAYEDGVWSSVGPGFTGGTACTGADPTVLSLLEVSLPGAAGLIAGGYTATAGAVSTLGIGRWHESAWHSMADGLDLGSCADCCPGVVDLAVFDDGSGPALYATGLFDIPSLGIARWSGAAWEDVGGGLSGFLWGYGQALAAHDDGSGMALYVGGSFDTAGGTPAANIARWDGTAWSSLGVGLPMPVAAFTEFEGKLIAAGGSPSAGDVWQWDGAAWSRLGGQFNGSVVALAVFDDGSGPALYAGGRFRSYAGQTIGGLARWDGSAWVQPAGGVGGSVYALEPEMHDGRQSLLVGGGFSTVGSGVSSHNIARLIGCPGACYPDCDDSGALDFFDFLCFQNAFAATTPYADCDDSGGHDFFDFLCFQNAFAAGCP